MAGEAGNATLAEDDEAAWSHRVEASIFSCRSEKVERSSNPCPSAVLGEASARRKDALSLAPTDGGRILGDVGPGSLALGHDPGPLEFEVGAGDRVGVDEKLLCQGSDGGQFRAWSELSGGDEIPGLVDDLKVDRGAAGGLDLDMHGTRTVLIH
jgi:hypothetical protein